MCLRRLWSLVSVALIIGCVNTPFNEDNAPVNTVQVRVSNNRSPEIYEPLFRLVSDRGNQIWIGRVASSTTRTLEIDDSKFQRGECFVTAVHFTGASDIRLSDIKYPSFCWSGDRHIDITLNQIISTSTAWSHN